MSNTPDEIMKLATPAPSETCRGREIAVLVVGAGPAGLAAATELALSDIGRIEVVDREKQAGGIPRHSHHTGYGLRDLHRIMTGPAYARHHVLRAAAAGAIVRTEVTVTGWSGPLTVDTTSPAGLERLTARAVILATGARERPRSARLVPGDRPAGVYTTGHLQQAIYLHHRYPGRRAVIIGAEHVSFSAAVTLAHAGTRVAAMITDLPRQQSYRAFRVSAALRYRFPLLTDTTVTRIVGRRRVEGVEIRRADGSTRFISCDLIVFTGDWVPDHELARRGGLAIDRGTWGPSVDTALHTSVEGVFAAGNLLHPVRTADIAALDGRFVADSVGHFLTHGRPAVPRVALTAWPPLRWIAPNLIRPGCGLPPRQRFVVWSDSFVASPRLTVTQGDRTLWSRRSFRSLVANRPYEMPAGWTVAVDPAAGPVAVRVSATGASGEPGNEP